ncbi:MAG: isoleucine--tRNA ligase, partial [Sediminibacterium sp.]|nr:isoleucine--tRNA ligase [Sediminibacterium sp.]
QLECQILNRWKNDEIFKKNIEDRKNAPPFIFYEGPPSANGLPGIHHVISRTIKDLFCRYKTMRGFQVLRKGGWDTHGLPVEIGVEKELGLTKEDIGKKISVEEFNQNCRDSVLKYKDVWDDITTKMGQWIDLENPYITFNNDYIESIWWILSQFYNKKLLYQSLSIQPYSPAAGTGLSSHELNQPGAYKLIKDLSIIAQFKIINNQSSAFIFKQISSQPVYILAWTTTPWTLPSNVALTVGAKINYSFIESFNPYSGEHAFFILADQLVSNFFENESNTPLNDVTVINELNKNWLFNSITNEKIELAKQGKIQVYHTLCHFSGESLEGISYEQIIPLQANKTNNVNCFKVILGDHVTTDSGTGIVHTAPAFGADDFKMGKKYQLDVLNLVDKRGRFVNDMEYVVEGKKESFSGKFVKNFTNDAQYPDVNLEICLFLKTQNKAFKIEKYEHNYPHCWRTDKPIIYYPLEAWFIKTTAFKERLIELNKTINWKPKSTGEGRFGNWLENIVDWNLSRTRYWGTPLPIWRSNDATEEICVRSVEELTSLYLKAKKAGFNKHLDLKINPINNQIEIDLHKPFVDQIELVSDTGKLLKRVHDLIDVWFDSGAMPYAQWHYPFENKHLIDNNATYPADFIAEGVDQTRGWFFTLHVISVLLNDKIAYKNVVSNGLVLDKNGNKMSKRLGNVVEPFKIMEKYGADAIRWYLITNSSPWENIKFDENGILEVQKKFLGTFYNTYQFFTLYANLDQFCYHEQDIEYTERPQFDRWILSLLQHLVQKVTHLLDDYEPCLAYRLVDEFLNDHLSNWYVRLNRRRFWKGNYDNDKISAFQTLYQCLNTLCKLSASVIPFITDEIYLRLNKISGKDKFSTIHSCLIPEFEDKFTDNLLEERMSLAQQICSLGLSIRKKENIKVRQPLAKIFVVVKTNLEIDALHQINDIILSELNIKKIEFIPLNNNIISKSLKPNFKLLGTKFGKKMKDLQQVLANFSQEQISQLELNGSIEVEIEAQTFNILLSEIEVNTKEIEGLSIAQHDGLTVALDIQLNENLIQEGLARELINRIQNIRKSNNYDVTDKISVEINCSPKFKEAFDTQIHYIKSEILAEQIIFSDHTNDSFVESEINQEKIFINIKNKLYANQK